MSVPIPEVPTLGTRQKGLAEATLNPRVSAGGPGRSFPREPEPRVGGGVQKAPREHWGCPDPGRVELGCGLHTSGKGRIHRETDTPGPAGIPESPAEAALPPGATNRQRRGASALKGTPPGFRRTRDVSTRRWQPGRLPAEVQVALGECGLQVLFWTLMGVVRFVSGPLRTVVEPDCWKVEL